MNDKATMLKMAMNDGTEVELTLTYGRLLKLREKNKALYERYNKLAMDGINDELDYVTMLYTGYLCANIESECMSEGEFIEKMPANHFQIPVLVGKLRMGNFEKKQDSGSPS